MRAQTSGVPTVVVGRQDVVLEREAEHLGSTYLRKSELDEHRFLLAVEARLASATTNLPPICRNLAFVRVPAATRPPTGIRWSMLN
jgi:hypothetical protein